MAPTNFLEDPVALRNQTSASFTKTQFANRVDDCRMTSDKRMHRAQCLTHVIGGKLCR